MSKHAQSGLGSIKRDWAESQSSSQPTDWPPSPPRAQPKLTGAQQRLKDIQDALSGKTAPLEKRPRINPPLSPSKRANKRLDPPADTTDTQPAKKPRHLPPGWDTPPPSNVSSQGSAIVASLPKAAAASSKKVAPVFLSTEQTHILKLVQEGNSVFYTGSAGTGKSVLLREIIKGLRKKYAKSLDAVAITASTGIAACNIGGVTLHSFAGIGVGADSTEDLYKRVKKNKKASTRWLRTKALIIDEVSMVDGDLFDKLSRIGSMMRKRTEPFGGIQIIVTGDFFQLPPVTKGTAKFAFEADLWSAAVSRTFNLTKVFRQRDETFVDMLNEMRFGRLTPSSIQKFRTLTRPIVYDDGVEATELFPRREDVDRSNMTRMAQLQGERHRYRSNDGGLLSDPTQRDKLLSNFMAPKELEVRTGAQVMLIKNVDEMLVNGSLGTIVEFANPEAYASMDAVEPPDPKKKPTTPSQTVYPVVEFLVNGGGKRKMLIQPEQWKVELPDGEVQVSRSQLPLIPAWAMSIHKSQGQTLERVKVDLGKVFEKGQAYVALSRATCLEGLQVLNFNPQKVNAHPKVVEWSRTLETLTDHA